MLKVVISACTYKRPEGLKALLESLQEIEIPRDIALSIRIIDNEDMPAAEELVRQFSEDMPCPLYYVNETDPGIAPARNRALIEAKGDDFLAFIDDDETAHKAWLKELLQAQKENHAQFVQGPVVMTVEDNKDAWWLETILFKLKDFPNHAERHEAWSNNVLIDMNFVREHDLAFDPALRFDGGEDTLFFQQMTAKRGKGVFASHAIVYETQPKERLNWSWAIRRQFRNGNTRAMIARKTKPPLKAFLHSTIRAAGCFVFSLIHLPAALIKGRVGVANCMAYAARCAGVLWGIVGRQYLEYNRSKTS